jgi:transposase
MLPTTPERRTRDYVRHGTTSLFAAYDLASGSVIAQHYRRHRHQEFLRFLKLIDTAVPKDLDLHLVLDNLSAHKAPPDQRWLLAHPRVQLHFTPTCSSWISQVERWFAELQRRCLDRGVFWPLDELTAALEAWIAIWNTSARPFKWTKTADQIIDRICRYCSRISGPGH